MATKSARRKLALATLRSLNSRRMEELIRIRTIRANKREILQTLNEIYHDEQESRKIIDGLAKRLQYEIVTHREFLHQIDIPEELDDNES